MEKTPGQIVYEAFEASLKEKGGNAIPWEGLPWQAHFEAGAKALLEHVAAMADKTAKSADVYIYDAGYAESMARTAESIADEIRGLIKGAS